MGILLKKAKVRPLTMMTYRPAQLTIGFLKVEASPALAALAHRGRDGRNAQNDG
jgi:hypothetical protein